MSRTRANLNPSGSFIRPPCFETGAFQPAYKRTLSRVCCCAVSLVFIAFGCDPLGYSHEHPSDASLVRNFQKHEESFNKLVRMSNEDSQVIRIAYDFTRLETNWAWPRPESKIGFSKERWNDYRRLFT